MLSNISKKAANYLVRNGYSDSCLRDWLAYGFENLIGTSFSIFVTLVLSLLFRSFPQTVLYLLFCYSLRRYTGGYHASTYFRCSLMTQGVWLLCALTARFSETLPGFCVMSVLFLAACFIIIVFAPVEPPETRRKPMLIVLAVIVLSVFLMLIIHVPIMFVHYSAFAVLVPAFGVALQKLKQADLN